MEQSLEKQVEESLVYQTIVVNNQNSYEMASGILRGVKGLIKQVEDSYNPIVSKALSAHREAIAQRDKYLNPLKKIELAVKNRISGYLDECEQKRRAEEIRLQSEAEEKARKEKEKLEARAEKWAEKGKTEKAEALKEQAEQVEAIVPTVSPIVQKVEGQSTRKVYKARVVDFSILSNDYKIVNQQLLDSIARNTKGQQKIAGVEYYEEMVLVSR